MKDYSKVLEKIENHVLLYYTTHHLPEIHYHNLLHTGQVVEACIQMAHFYDLSEPDYFVLLSAAWFHDIAYGEGIESHEKRGAAKATLFLKNHSVPNSLTCLVENCIRSTRLPQQPVSLLEEIICDADLFHLGREDFAIRSNLLHQEIEALSSKRINPKEWMESTLLFLENHHYFTTYCQQHLSHQKKKNTEQVKMKLAILENSNKLL